MKSIALTLAVLLGAFNMIACAEDTTASAETQKPVLEEVVAEEEGTENGAQQ